MHSLISGNVLTDFNIGGGGGGGGIALNNVRSYSGATVIRNCTIYHNFAYHNAGGIGIFDATTGNDTLIEFTTISKNSTAFFYSNGIQGAGTPAIYSSIVANNQSGFYTQDMVGHFLIRYSLVKNTTGITIAGGSSNDIFGMDPQLGKLTVNGGPTLSMLPAQTSPVLDKAEVIFPEMYDQRGLPRKVGSGADMGAVERQSPEVIIFRNGRR